MGYCMHAWFLPSSQRAHFCMPDIVRRCIFTPTTLRRCSTTSASNVLCLMLCTTIKANTAFATIINKKRKWRSYRCTDRRPSDLNANKWVCISSCIDHCCMLFRRSSVLNKYRDADTVCRFYSREPRAPVMAPWDSIFIWNDKQRLFQMEFNNPGHTNVSKQHRLCLLIK